VSAQTAIVVGAGSGLGRATAIRLASTGAVVVAVDRNEAGLNELPDSIRREVADATDPSVPTPLVDRIVQEIGPPDILVNTIGAYDVNDALSATPETLRLMVDVNVGPALWLTQAVVPSMAQRGSGSIVHVTARASQWRNRSYLRRVIAYYLADSGACLLFARHALTDQARPVRSRRERSSSWWTGSASPIC
jgi:NADP-dependent 3-hydroxy acid dehydrogenase YdfG